MTELVRQPPFTDKKKLWWLLLFVVLAPIPIYITDLIETATGMTETAYLEKLSPEERQALEKEVQDQEQVILTHFQTVKGKSEDEIAKDQASAFYILQLMVRDLLGPTKIIRFPTIKQVEFAERGQGGIDVTGEIFLWGQKNYASARMEATLTYKGNGWWKLERLNIPGKRGILRMGMGMEMPKDKIVFSTSMFYESKAIPTAETPAP